MDSYISLHNFYPGFVDRKIFLMTNLGLMIVFWKNYQLLLNLYEVLIFWVDNFVTII